MDAGFLNVVQVGQYFMTKDTEEFSQFTDSVACRGYTLPRDESLSEPEGWIRGNTKIGPVLEVTTCCLEGKYGVEIRNESVNKDNSHSWVRISQGLNELVTNLNNQEQGDNEQETSEMQFEDYALRSNARAFGKPTKSQSNTTKMYFCHITHKNYTYYGKNLDRHWSTRLFAHRLFSFEETDQSSSSWWSTSRRRGSDWILEIFGRWSSEPFCVLTSLVWRKVEDHRRRILALECKFQRFTSDMPVCRPSRIIFLFKSISVGLQYRRRSLRTINFEVQQGNRRYSVAMRFSQWRDGRCLRQTYISRIWPAFPLTLSSCRRRRSRIVGVASR